MINKALTGIKPLKPFIRRLKPAKLVLPLINIIVINIIRY
jgi:hypothetical protein